jgi:hypothetical protein
MSNNALRLLDEALSLLTADATPQMQERAALRLIDARALLSHAAPQAEQCGCCGGSGWMVRDPDIGTDQECFACNGTGECEEDAASPVSAPAVSHADAVQIVHEEAGRTLSKDDFDLCMRIAKRALTRPTIIDKSTLKRLATQHGYRLVDDAPAQPILPDTPTVRFMIAEAEQDAALEAEVPKPVGYMMKHATGTDIGFSWNPNDPQFDKHWQRIPLYAEPAAQSAEPTQDSETAKRKWLEYAETEVGDKRISEMSPSQREDAHELWLRKQIGWMGGYHIEHYQFLLKRIDELRDQLSTARAEGRQEGIEEAAKYCQSRSEKEGTLGQFIADSFANGIRALLDEEHNHD